MSSTPKAIDASELAKVTGGTHTDRWGTDGADTIATGDGMDKIFAGGGNDHISSGGGTDEVHAGAGSDFVNAGTGDDKVFGGEGNDTIQGRLGSDELHGEGGNDALDGGYRDGAADKAFGGEGNDTYIWSPGDGNDEFHGGNGQDTLFLHNVNLETFQNAVQLYNPGLQMLLASDGTMSFTDQSGTQVPFSGQVTIGGETMKFFDVERIKISF
jgi:Ca2+-binding RTX toxin-like protein